MSRQSATFDTTEVFIPRLTPFDQFVNPALVYLVGLTSQHTQRSMRHALDVIAGLLSEGGADGLTYPWSQVRVRHIRSAHLLLAERYAPATANKMLSALRGVLKVCWRLGHLDLETYRQAMALERVDGERPAAGRSVSGGEIVLLLDACAADHSPAGKRDAAMIALLHRCGLQPAELVGLELGDYEVERGELRVRGGRDRERRVPIVNGVAEALADWLSARGEWPGPLFVSICKGGRVQQGGARLTPQAVANILHQRAAQAGVGKLSPHDLRRAFVRDGLAAGADTLTVPHLAGLLEPTAAARQERSPVEARRRAAQLLQVPYRRRT